MSKVARNERAAQQIIGREGETATFKNAPFMTQINNSKKCLISQTDTVVLFNLLILITGKLLSLQLVAGS